MLNTMRKLISTIVLLSLFIISNTQSLAQTNEKISSSKALLYVEDGNWEKAKQIYLELLKENPNDTELNLYCGVTFLNSRVNTVEAINYFNKVSETEYPGVIILKAESYHYMGQFDSAKVYYEKYKNIEDVKIEDGLLEEMDLKIQQCNTGIQLTDNPINGLNVENLGADVNTMFIDYAPVVYEDLKTLVLTSANANLFSINYMTYQDEGQEEIFYTNYDPVYKKWLSKSKADKVVLNDNIDSEDNESSITYNEDLSQFYFFRDGKLFVSTNMEDPIEFKINHSGFPKNKILAISIDKKLNDIFITSDKKGGKGGTDIYHATKNEDGEFSKFEALKGINTEMDESSPFLSEGGNKLYFASKGHNSIGDYDIFYATKTDTGWGNITNMGVPVNSPANDIHFRLTGDNAEFGYLASDRMGNIGDYDIWRVWTCYDIPSSKLDGHFLALEGQKIDSAELTLMNIDSTIVASVNPLTNNGDYSFNVNTETPYILSLDVKGRATHTFNLTIPKQCSKYDLYHTLSCELKMDADSFVFEQKSTLTNAYYNIDDMRDTNSRESFIANLPTENPSYTDPEIKTTTWEKDDLMALLPDAVKNADGKMVHEIYFGFDNTSISKKEQDYITTVAEILKSKPNLKIVINGHTDSQGPADYNITLSEKRAQAVAKYFTKNGIDQSQIITNGYGESQLKIKDINSKGKLIPSNTVLNRRCEIEIK